MSSHKSIALATVAAGTLHAARAVAADTPAANLPSVDSAFEALKTYDWGTDRNLLKPIDEAVVAAHGDAAARQALEARLVGVLQTGASRDAKDFVCRKLMMIGTTGSIAAIAELLPDKELSHMARYALERIPAPEAAQALRDALPKVSGPLKVGVIGSLGARRDVASVAALTTTLADADPAVAGSAICALGDIGDAAAAKALGNYAPKAPEALRPAVADALLVAAERLLADGKKAEALSIYNSLSGPNQPKQVRLAATRGRLNATGKKD